MSVDSAPSEFAILSRILQPRAATLSVAAARAWLKVDFTQEDRERMHALGLKAQEGSLSEEDTVELDGYRRVGRLLDFMHSKARVSLKKHRSVG